MKIFDALKKLKPAEIEEVPDKPKPMDYTEEQLEEARKRLYERDFDFNFSHSTEVNYPVTQVDFFKVVGVTFDNEDGTNRQDIIKKIIKNFKNPIKYDGLTTSDLKADGYPDVLVFEWAGNYFPLQLEEYEYESAPALHVVSDFGIVGNIGKKDIKTIMSIMEEYPSVEFSGSVTGGRYKKTQYKDCDDYDDYDDYDYDDLSIEVIDDKYDDYGIELRVEYQ